MLSHTTYKTDLTKTASVRLDTISKFYEEGDKRLSIFHNVTAEFATGEFTVLLGKSGSGKSTLLNLISGIDTPTRGDVWIGSIPITRLSERERTLFRRTHIGIVFQFYNLIPTLTVLENVTLPQELAGSSQLETRNRGMMLLERVGLNTRSEVFPDRLSGGEKQRVAIARSLIHNPDLILADEPTGNLDAETSKQVLDLIIELTRDSGKTLIMATHSTDILYRADRVFTIQNSHLVAVDDNKKSLIRNW